MRTKMQITTERLRLLTEAEVILLVCSEDLFGSNFWIR